MIVAGGVGNKGMTTQSPFLDFSKIQEDIIQPMDETILCYHHPMAGISVSFGLAGGGYGSYTLCNECCRVLTKTMENPDDQ